MMDSSHTTPRQMMKTIKNYVPVMPGQGILDMSRALLKQGRDYILNDPWDEWLIRQDKALEKYAIWPFLAFVIVYFAYCCYMTLSAMK